MNSLPKELDKEKIEAFLAHCHKRRYPARTTLIYAGEESTTLYYLIKGSVSVIVEDDDGREMVMAYLNDGDFFGELGLFNEPNSTLRSAWVKAKNECEVAEISYSKFHDLLKNDLSLVFPIFQQIASRLNRTTKKASDLAFLDVTGRVAHTLLELCREPDAMTHPNGMQIRITRQEIGRIVGCSREMVGRVLKELEEQALISVKGKTMVVHGARRPTYKKK